MASERTEDLIDEMLAILSDREEIIRKKEAEHAHELLPVKRTEKKYKIFPASS